MEAGIQILQKAEDAKLYKDLIIQLNKDFLRAGIADQFGEDVSAEALVRNLTASLYATIVSDFEVYLNLLYTIDVSESKIKKLPQQEVHEFALAVSELILEREFMKVFLKIETNKRLYGAGVDEVIIFK
ncbi:hypothetical protein DSM03_101290 [Leeuwenhoekiella aestuarii]|uniref:Uncharacterized protein n=1 Tax=Leeuwenhoekiella aestuarii TaxID=2249426 RepID=A0A4Q0NUD4_9FLAO|nr:hypothetical protein [Leeuwenhoekiella aestuarii]RXG14173.1 hypothetical protein DSM04_104281 [Leeuwenhoekiella aestuarii]RXG18922.1 hypothetical protein DSM03_101290 [Leeuwenhoekiella aestuarii]